MKFFSLPVLISLLAGAATVFAFAPFHGWPLQMLALVLLFLLVLRAPSVQAAFLLGWVFGMASIAAGTHWLYVSMHDYGGMPSLMAATAVLLLAAGLGLLYGLALAGAKHIAARMPPLMVLMLLMPACWTLADWTRNWIFTGFPWVATGYAHNISPLAGYAPVVGVFGVGFIACVVAGSLATMIQLRQLHRTSLALLIALPGLGSALATLHWTTPQGQPITVRLLQGNVPQEMKFDAAQLDASLRLYLDMITERRADLIATPETAVPMLASHLPAGYLEQLESFAKGQDSRLLIGIPWSTAPGIYFNSVLGLGGNTPYRYDKHHLVPFGEFIPTGFRWFVDMMQIPLGDFGRGDLQQPAFQVRDQWVLPNVCYEDIFGEEIGAQLAAASDRGAPVPSLLLNVSNIAWFGDTIALPQHLQASQMRSLELGRPMLRATNTGATAVIDERGRVAAQLTPFTRGTLEARVQGTQGLTPYARIGNGLPVGLAVAVVALLWLRARRVRQPPFPL
jgi:apolipoprotein N-acyltransferase